MATTDLLRLRQRHDQSVLAAAQQPAEHAAQALLHALRAEGRPEEIAALARLAVRVISALADAAARMHP